MKTLFWDGSHIRGILASNFSSKIFWNLW